MPDKRTYIRLHDGMPDHPKIDGLSDKAFRLLVERWCWCSRNTTDGRILTAVWLKKGSPKARAELVSAGLVEVHDGFVLMHDYLEHQRSAEEIAEAVGKKRAGAALGNHRRWHRNGVTDPACEHCPPAEPTDPDPTNEASHDRSDNRSDRESEFDNGTATSEKILMAVGVTTVPESNRVNSDGDRAEMVVTSSDSQEPRSHNRSVDRSQNGQFGSPEYREQRTEEDSLRSSSSSEADERRPDVEELCERLAAGMVRNKCKRPKIGKSWRDAARLMLDTDGRDLAKALTLIDWCQADAFWRSNIHSMPKFREKYDRLRLKALSEWERDHQQSGPGAPVPGGTTGSKRVDKAMRYLASTDPLRTAQTGLTSIETPELRMIEGGKSA